MELWTNDPSTFDGRFVNFEGVRFAPKPAQKPHPPIWVGGRSNAALHRAVRFGEAWHPTSMALDVLRERMARLQEMSAEVGRDTPPVTTIHQPVGFQREQDTSADRRLGRGLPEQVAEDLAVYTDMGIPMVVCNFRGTNTDEVRRAMETFARRVMPQF